MDSPAPPTVEPIDQAALDRKRELDIKEREVAAHEREVAAKEADLKKSAWLSPTVIGLFVAALGLIGSIVVARVNNSNTQEVERLRSQSTLVLEAIKTGSPDSACKNLTFFVGLGLLDDSSQTIRKECASAPAGAPSLPSNRPDTPANGVIFTGKVYEEGTGAPIPGATVSAPELGVSCVTSQNGQYVMPYPNGVREILLRVQKDGYETWEVRAPPIPGWNIALRKKK
jgi:hypothetical protein